MVSIKRADSSHIDFQKLIRELDLDLEIYYKEETSFYGELNAIDKIKYTVIVYDEEQNPVGCGGIKEYSPKAVEIKRMYIKPTYRGKGIATLVLNELEKWAIELNFKKCILETLKDKPYAIGFYKKNNYKTIPNFGEYIKAENSICFEKELN